MYCVIAAEPGAAEVIKENLLRCFPGWQFETATNAGMLYGLSGRRPDVVLVSRFLPGDSADNILQRLPVEFPASHTVLLVGVLNEQAKAYVRLAAKNGLTNVVTGKLPGDRPYTIFTALTQARQEMLEVEGLEWVEEENCGAGQETAAETGSGRERENSENDRTMSGPVQGDQVLPESRDEKDLLTGCYTRRFLESARLELTYSVVFIDLDNFKPVNDILGHEAGDMVLAAFGRTLAENLRGRDLAVRWGGDEFVLVLLDTPPEGAEVVVEKIRQAWEKEAPATGNLKVGFSYGLASGKGAGGLLAAVSAADRAMYAAKQEKKQAPLLKQSYERKYARRSDGKFVLVAANKGGVGKTTAAIALSLVLSRKGAPVCLCDFDFGGPNIAVFFDIKNKPGIEKLSGKRHVERFAKELLVKVEPNLVVLPGPMDKTLPYFEPGQLAEIVDFLAQEYLVIGDTPPEFWTKPWLDGLFPRADLVLAVVDQSKFSEAETKDYAPKLLLQGVDPSRIRIVCNRFSAKLHSVKKVEAFFNAGIKAKKDLPRVIAAVPEDWEEFVKGGYRANIPRLDDPSSPWQKLAQEVAKELDLPLAGISGQEKKKPFTLFRRG